MSPASSWVAGIGAVMAITFVAVVRTRWTYRPIKGRAGVIASRALLGLAVLTGLAAVVVFAFALHA